MNTIADIPAVQAGTPFPLAKFSALETPFYYYSTDLLKATLEELTRWSQQYGYHVHYALKANVNDRLLQIIRSYGIGADCVSGNEVKRAIESGFTKENVVFAGVGKSDKEIDYALEKDIFCFNCESIQEIQVINELAARRQTKARIALRINPNVNANTHKYITTGLEENKFGINSWELETVLALFKTHQHIELVGIHFHIGSQINDLNAFRNLCIRVNEIVQWFENHNTPITHLNMGGGLGVDYTQPDTRAIPDFKSYFAIFNSFLEVKPHQKVHFELGRSIIAQCGSLIARVLYIKKGLSTNFAILDAGMTELIRPALYQAYHKIENISKGPLELTPASATPSPGTHSAQQPDSKALKYDVVGPVCESSDCFGKAVLLPETVRGDLIAIRTAGAYGEVMVSGYNLRDRVKAVYSDDL
jgi:diaminopimelate decarboxylase